MSIMINKTNYHQYKKVFGIIWDHKLKLLPPELDVDVVSPIKILERWEATSLSAAHKALQSGLSDLFTQISHFDKPLQLAIDNELKINGLPGLNALATHTQTTLNQVLKCREITSVAQYYVIQERLSDTSMQLNDNDRNALNDCLLSFELKQRPGHNKL